MPEKESKIEKRVEPATETAPNSREKNIEATRAEFAKMKSQIDSLIKTYEDSLVMPGHTVSDENILDSLELMQDLNIKIKLARNLIGSVEED